MAQGHNNNGRDIDSTVVLTVVAWNFAGCISSWRTKHTFTFCRVLL